jgi:hypothetical protein
VHAVVRLGPNAYGEQLRPGRVDDCYLGILLDQPLAEVAPEPGHVLVVAPAVLLHEQVPQPHGQVVYDLLTGHPDRASQDLVFLADLTVELRAWPQQTWTALEVSPEAECARRVGGRAWWLVRGAAHRAGAAARRGLPTVGAAGR